MVKEEIWSISIDRARRFFREQPDVSEGSGGFRFGDCHIVLTELTPKNIGIWASKRIRVRMEGSEADVLTIYHRFFIQFLSAGG